MSLATARICTIHSDLFLYCFKPPQFCLLGALDHIWLDAVLKWCISTRFACYAATSLFPAILRNAQLVSLISVFSPTCWLHVGGESPLFVLLGEANPTRRPQYATWSDIRPVFVRKDSFSVFTIVAALECLNTTSCP